MKPTKMAIDKSGTWWRGEEFADVAQYLRDLTEEGYPVEIVLQSTCGCRETKFLLDADQTEGCARRTCPQCEAEAFVGDSEEYWEESEPERSTCRCGAELFELGIGFSLRNDGEICWLTIGQRCVACGLLGSFVDWKVDYAPTDHLYEKT